MRHHLSKLLIIPVSAEQNFESEEKIGLFESNMTLVNDSRVPSDRLTF